MRHLSCLGRLGLLALLCCLPGLSRSATLVVSNCTESAFASALSSSAAGDTIRLTCDGTITLTTSYPISQNVTLDGSGHSVTLSGGNTVRPFSVSSGVTFTLLSLTVAYGFDTSAGGAIYNSGNLVACYCSFNSNRVVAPNGQAGTQGTTNSDGNPGGAGTGGSIAQGGAIYNGGTLMLSYCTFTTNTARAGNGGAGGKGGYGTFGLGGNGGSPATGGYSKGGAICSSGSLSIIGCRFQANLAGGGIGGAGGDGGDGYYGGGNGVTGGSGNVSLGGAIFASSSLAIDGSYFTQNVAAGGGGGVGGAVGVGGNQNGTQGIGGNGADGSGAGVYSTATCTISATTFDSGQGIGGSGGNAGGGLPATLSSGSHGGNGANGYGGAINNVGTGALLNCTLYNDAAVGGSGGRGGNAVGTAGNGGPGGSAYGGGFRNDSGATTGITNCTMSTCGVYYGAGGAGGTGSANGSQGTAGSASGANIFRGGNAVTLKNSIFAYKLNDGNGAGTFTDAGQNISSDTSMNLNGTGSLTNTDPKINSLAFNGGLPPTCSLQSSTPATNKADVAAAPRVDGRGFFRDTTPDIGAYELGAGTFGYLSVNIQATDNYAGEGGPNTAMFNISRSGETNISITIGLDISGTASNGVDYATLPTSVVLPIGVMQTNLLVTPLSNDGVEPAETVVVGLKPGSNYQLGLYTNAVVTISGDGPIARAVYPTTERYVRGAGTNLDWYSIIVPLDGLKGTGRSAFEISNNLATLYQYNGALAGTQSTTNNRIACNTPVASFGTGWGSPLYLDRSYSVAVHPSSGVYNPIYIFVFARTNGAYVGNISVTIPGQTNWTTFATNGFALTSSGFGLTTILRTSADATWGSTSGAYVLTHSADSTATNYTYLVYARGQFNGQEAWLDQLGQPAPGYLYSFYFDSRAGWRSTFLDQPHFTGQPLPPDLLNKTPEELLNWAAVVTNTVQLDPATCTNLDQSPELRRHPILDQFVSDLNNDPLALANYVQNEIALSDGIGWRDDGQVQSESVNLGGVNRSALAVFQEGQGSPLEQCALLIYLLRRANVPAAYVFPPDGGLQLLDTRLSQLLRMQFVGASDELGHLYTTNRLIAVNYPWVAAYINGSWVHLFPWLKDTQVTEGLKLQDYLPSQYKQLQLWVKDYVLGKTNLTKFAQPDDDTPSVVFPAYLKDYLSTAAPGVSLDDIGMQYVDRRHAYAQWSDFPRPTVVTNVSTTVESLAASAITNVSPRLTNVFDTVIIQLFSLVNPSKVIQTPEMRMADLHNRKFFLTHTNLTTGQCQATLWLAPYSTYATGQGSFSSSDTGFTNKQVATITWDSIDDKLRLRIRYRRQKALNWQTAVDVPAGFLELNSMREILQERPLRKGDVAAICLNTGKVTPAMLRVHAQDLWNMEQQLDTNSAAASTIPVDVYQGSLVYLLGMDYYERGARFDDLNRRLNKIQKITQFDMGLAKLSPARNVDGTLPSGPIDPVWPNVDMFFRDVTVAGNGTVRLDSGWDLEIARRNYSALSVADLSAQEHAVLNKFFGQSAAVSSVKLLQLAQAKVPTGGSNVVELTQFNYLSAGTNLYGGVMLKNQDPDMWSQVTNYFNRNLTGPFVIAWMTPGIQTTPSGSYSGMAALLLDPYEQLGLIGNNLMGGYADRLAAQAASQANTTNFRLLLDANDNYTFNSTAPQSGQGRAADEVYTSFDAMREASLLANNAYAANPNQNLQGVLNSLFLNQVSGSYANSLPTADDLGLTGTKPDYRPGNGLFATLADPVNTLTGEFYVDTVDLSLPGPMPLQVRRNYGSQNLANNQLGYGWKLNYMPFLSLAQTNSIVYEAEADGSVLAFGLVGTNTSLWAPSLALNPTMNNNSSSGIGSLANPLNARLAKLQVGSTNNWYLTNSDGSLRVFQEMSFPLTNSASYDRLRPYLMSWFDNRSNYYRFEYGTNPTQGDYGQVRRILSSSGNIVRLLYDPYSRVVEAYSLDGRRVQYDYDQHGDLVRATMPDTSEIIYGYQVLNWVANSVTNAYSTHLLLTETKPDGRVLKNEYDDQRRVTNQWSTVGPDLRLVRSATFRYTNNFNLTNLTALPTGTTTVLDYTNNITFYAYTNGLIRRIQDPLGGLLVQDWFEATETNAPAYPRSLKTVTDKRGLVTSYLYDAQGNVTNTTWQGDLRGDGDTNATASMQALYTANNLPMALVNANGTTNLYFYTNTWLLARLESWPSNAAPAQAITNLYAYVNVTNASDGTFANGLRAREIRAAFSPDAATNDWNYSARGFPTNVIRYTGTMDPPVTMTNFFNTRGELVKAVLPQLSTVNLGYDPRGNLQSKEVFDTVQPAPISWEYSLYNGNGELVWSDGPRYNPEDYVWRDYDGAGRKVQEIHWRSQGRIDGGGVEAPADDSLYATTFLEYDPLGNQVKATAPMGNYTVRKFDANGQLKREEFYDASGVLLATNGFVYSIAGDATNAFNALGGLTSKAYTSTGKPKFQQNSDGSTATWRYYADGRLFREFISNGSYWEATYNDAARTTTRIFYSSGAVPLATNISVLDRRGNLVRRVDAGLNTFTNAFDGLDRPKIQAGPPVLTILLSSDSRTKVTNIVQQISSYFYDASGKVLTVSNAIGERTVTTRDALARPVSVQIYASNAVTPLRVSSTSYTADHQGFTVTEGTGANAVSTTTYTDNDGQAVLSLLYPSPGLVQYTWRQYDWNGNEVENALFSTDTNSAWSFGLNSYDGLNRLKSQTSRDSATTTYYRDPMGNVTNRLMPGGLQWSGIYDNAGQLLQEWNTGNSGLRERTNTYFYSAGLLRTNIDPVNDHGTYTYDDFQRLAATLHYLPDSDEWPLDTAYLYDPRGLITSIIESLWVFTETEVVRSYDAYGQLTGENTPIGVNAWANQAWDGAGRRVYLDFGYMAYRFGWQADGLLTNVTANGGSSSFTYDDAGRLVSRTTGQRQTTVASRDGAGRPLSVNTTVNGAAALSEALTWTSDGLINSHTLQRFGTAGFIDSRAYVYADLSRRLQQERCNIDATSRWTNSFAYDGGTAAGIGMLTKIDSGGAGGATWTSSPDSFSRPASETNVAMRRLAYGRLNGTAAVTALLDNRPMPVETIGTSDHDWTNQWRTLMDLTPGAHRLQVTAAHPSGLFTTNAAVWFTNNASAEIATDGFDAVGRLTQRVWRSPSGATNRNQGLYWDQKNRLSLTEETDALNNGYVVSSSYDGLNRRICYDYQPRTNGTLVNEIRVHTFSFDPATEFLELGVFVGTFTTGEINWKLYGPDLDGRYGGLNGTGGLEAIMPEVGPMRPVIADVRGNILGEVTNGVVSWNPSRPTGYGAVPGSRPVAFGFGATLAQASAWRGRCPDVTGYIWLGARYYNPESGTFLNSDPAWNGRDPSYYSFAGGDPINSFDPDGRCIERLRSSESFSTVQEGVWGAEEGFDAIANFALGLAFKPQYGETPRLDPVQSLTELFTGHPAYEPSSLGGGMKQASAELVPYGQDVMTAYVARPGVQAMTVSTAPSRATQWGAELSPYSYGSAQPEGGAVVSPDTAMRANVNAPGTYINPLTGTPASAQENLAADHIVPQWWIRSQSGFDALTPEQQSWILNNPMNAQGLPRTFNSSKGGKQPDVWTTYKTQPLDLEYMAQQSVRAVSLRAEIRQQIENFVAENQNSYRYNRRTW